MIVFRRIESPIGPLLIAADERGLCNIEFRQSSHPVDRSGWRGGNSPFLDATEEQLGEYFAGKRRQFDLALSPQGTDFQLRVWRALETIPYGQTISYAELARRVGNPKASRAVGLANGRNPLSIIVPCHRVIGADGSLTGYGGGLPIKEFLLRLEGALPAENAGLFAAHAGRC